jgi:hypothetical protein
MWKTPTPIIEIIGFFGQEWTNYGRHDNLCFDRQFLSIRAKKLSIESVIFAH